MGYVAVENLKQGMVLDENVHDINTRLLLSKGQKIAPNHIRVLKIWGIAGVSVVGSAKDKPADTPAMDDEKIESVKKAINLVFKNVDLTNPTLKEIYKTSLIHRLKGDFANAHRLAGQIGDDKDPASNPKPISGQIEKIDNQLPETPTIIAELNRVIDDPLATSNDVARVVNQSPSLAATILKMVNSAYYGFPSKIDRISRAVTIIGTKEISGLALGICVMQAFKDIPKQIINMQDFIRHSLACGIIARILAALNNVAQTEQLFVSGLLHDIGKLVVYKYYSEHAKACFFQASSSDTCVFQAENKIIGMNHPQIAKTLLKKWQLPIDLNDNIVFHHLPSKAPTPERVGIVHLADIISHGLGVGSSGERSIPSIDYTIIDTLVGANPNIKMVVRQAVHQLGPMEAIFSS